MGGRTVILSSPSFQIFLDSTIPSPRYSLRRAVFGVFYGFVLPLGADNAATGSSERITGISASQCKGLGL